MRKMVLLVLLVASVLISCSTIQSPPASEATVVIEYRTTPTATSSGTPTISATTTEPSLSFTNMQALLNYVPLSWANLYLSVPFGPAIYLIDVAQVRTDLDIPPVSGVDSREDKLELILGLITQGLDLVPSSIHPLDGTAFNEWGWDIADIDQVLYLPDYEISILMGNFARNEIRERLSEKGYTQHLMGDFSLFASETKRLQFALKSDTLIVSASEDNDAITTIIQYVEAERPALNTSESLESIFKQFDGAWGVVLAPRADFVGFWEQYDALNPASYKERLPKIDALYQQESNELSSSQLVGWDFMAISFYAVEKESVLNFIYHYPSEKEAAASLELVEKTLTETPSFRSPGQVWGKFMSLEGIKVDAQLVIAQTRTPSRSLLGSAFKSRDHWAFVPFLIEE